MTRTALAAALLIGVSSSVLVIAAEDSLRPNILWITSEDNGPHLGCYGDEYATTPKIGAINPKTIGFI